MDIWGAYSLGVGGGVSSTSVQAMHICQQEQPARLRPALQPAQYDL